MKIKQVFQSHGEQIKFTFKPITFLVSILYFTTKQCVVKIYKGSEVKCCGFKHYY